jgi:hypothetical protein
LGMIGGSMGEAWINSGAYPANARSWADFG